MSMSSNPGRKAVFLSLWKGSLTKKMLSVAKYSYHLGPLDSATSVGYGIVFWSAFPFLRTFWPVGFIVDPPC